MSLISILGKNVKPFTGTAVTPDPDPTPIVDTYLIVFNGESNSGGYAENVHATTYEKSARSSVQKLNEYSFEFEDLHVTVNNLQDHYGFVDNSSHGWEVGLANETESGTFTGLSQVHLVKSGQGASIIEEWNLGGTYFNKLTARYNAAVSDLNAQSKTFKTIVWYTQGINNALIGSNLTTWKSLTIAHISNLRDLMGEDTPILFSEIMAGSAGAAYNTKITEICAEVPNCYMISCDSATLRDTNHWDYAGMKLIAGRMALKTNELLNV